MKKLLAILLVLSVCVILLASCDSNDSRGPAKTAATTEKTTEVTTGNSTTEDITTEGQVTTAEPEVTKAPLDTHSDDTAVDDFPVLAN